jgi:hypothetical protein
VTAIVGAGTGEDCNAAAFDVGTSGAGAAFFTGMFPAGTGPCWLGLGLKAAIGGTIFVSPTVWLEDGGAGD